MDNETNETKWQADTIKLAEVMTEISTEFELSDIVSTLPFSEIEIANFTELLDLDWDSFKNTPKNEEEQEEEPQKVKCPKCGHEFSLD